MNNLVEIFEKKQIAKLTSKKNIPAFRPGDTVRVTIKIAEGERSRLQAYEGVCIARKNNSVNSKFTVRKVSHGEGVERVFPLFSPIIDKIEVIKSFKLPDTLGGFYATFTEFLGFRAYHDEGKVMGLASYGKYQEKLQQKQK